MTTRPIVSLPQLDALEAAASGTLTRLALPTDYGRRAWRIDDGPTVTATVTALLTRGLIEETEPGDDDRIVAVLTAAGREILADLASRAGDPR